MDEYTQNNEVETNGVESTGLLDSVEENPSDDEVSESTESPETTEKKTRTRRTKEEIRKDLEAKIERYKKYIQKCEEKLKKLDTPDVTFKDITKRAKESGVSADELMKLLEKSIKNK